MRSQRAPEFGPRILFFSGGNALRKLSRVLKSYTHNSIHLVTPFDSGGSSARLREAFGMLSVGDLRNRLLSLADETVSGNPEIYRLFTHRLATESDLPLLRTELDALVSGTHSLIADVPASLQRLVRTHLNVFRAHMPKTFDLRNASIGNLVITGAYLSNERDIDSVSFLFSQLVQVHGIVRPVVDADLYLQGRLRSGALITGQHLLTGKTVEPVTEPIEELHLVSSLTAPKLTTVRITEAVSRLIRTADVICFPMGSFYTSLLANLLPEGVGQAIIETPCPKIFVPNTYPDPEMLGLSVGEAAAQIVKHVRAQVGSTVPTSSILNAVLVDTKQAYYGTDIGIERLEELGVEVIDTDLVYRREHTFVDSRILAEILISVA